MSDRRKFLQQSGAMALGSLIYPWLSRANSPAAAVARPGIGLQLYTLGNLMESDPVTTLQKVAAIGFRELESAGSSKGNYYGYTPKQFAAMIKDLGMVWRSEHVMGFPLTMAGILKMAKNADDSARIQKMAPMLEGLAKMPNLRNNTQQLVDEAAEGGVTYMVCAAIPLSTMDEIRSAADLLNKTGEACKKAGLQFAYHNHVNEFVPVDGVVPFDYLMTHTDKDLVKSELDLGWVAMAGLDPVEVIRKYSGRIPLWHVKDFNKQSKESTLIGEGSLDFPLIFANSGVSGMKYFFIEQEGSTHPLEDIAANYKAVKKIMG